MPLTHNSTCADNEPAWATVDKAKLPRNAFADQGAAGQKSTWAHPHHWVKNGGNPDDMGCDTTGDMMLHKGGMDAAMKQMTAKGVTGAPMEHMLMHRKSMGTMDGMQSNAPARFRAYGPKGLKAIGVDREHRVVRGYAVLTRGEAIGHGLWIDSEMLDQTVAAGNAAPKGIKSRFTHPGLCSDGLGKYLGRARNFSRDGDVVRADLHLSDVAGKSPEFDRDPAEYVMALAEKDPEAFATSIVWYPDRGAEARFIAAHKNEDGEFDSPDADNARDLPHGRLAQLVASDLVDEPAANPGGFFSQTEETAVVAEKFLSWILGLSDVAPGPEAMGGGNPNRIREFFYGFLDRHGLEVLSKPSEGKESEMADEKTKAPLAPSMDELQAQARAQFAANLKGLREAFPKDESFAVLSAADGLSVEAAKAKYSDVLAGRLAASDAKIVDLEKSLAAQKTENEGIKAQLLGGAAPVPHSPDPKVGKDADAEFAGSEDLQKEFGSVEAYKAYLKAMKDGRAQVLTK